MKLSRRQFVALSLAGCGGQRDGVTPYTEVSSPGPPDTSASPVPRLVDFDEGDHARVMRRTVYTWTTSEQALELRGGGALFSREERPRDPGSTTEREVDRAGYLFTHLTSMASGSPPDVNAIELLTPRFKKGRYAWIVPWATCLGFGEEKYGDELLRVVLRSDAVFARFFTKTGKSDVVGLDSRAVPRSKVDVAKLAGAYFVRGGCDGRSTIDLCHGESAYRELYLGNLAMVESWSLRTEVILAEIDAFADKLKTFADEVRPSKMDDETWRRVLTGTCWENPMSKVDRYESNLAFADPRYRPHADNLRALAARMRTTRFEPDPLEVHL